MSLKRSRSTHDHREACVCRACVLDRFGEARAHQFAVGEQGQRIVVRQERYALLGMLALADIAEFKQSCRAAAIRDGARRDLDRDGFARPVDDLGIEPQCIRAEQRSIDVGVAHERRNHQVRGILARDPNQAAQAGVHRDRLHAAAHRDAFVENVEQCIKPAHFIRSLTGSPHQCGDAESACEQNDERGSACADRSGQSWGTRPQRSPPGPERAGTERSRSQRTRTAANAEAFGHSSRCAPHSVRVRSHEALGLPLSVRYSRSHLPRNHYRPARRSRKT